MTDLKPSRAMHSDVTTSILYTVSLNSVQSEERVQLVDYYRPIFLYSAQWNGAPLVGKPG